MAVVSVTPILMEICLSSQCIRVLVVDDHWLLRQAIGRILEREAFIEIVGQCESGARAIALYAQLRPDVTLMDVQMPGVGGFDALNAIRSLDANACVLMMSLHPNDARVVRAFKAGAAGCLPKSMLHRYLREAILVVHEGSSFFPTPANIGAPATVPRLLSDDELELLKLVSLGLADEAIAARLGVPIETVVSKLNTVLVRLAASDRRQAIAIAARHGLLDRDD